ncbi:Flagellar hook-basal body complex protein FliE [bioreactor metagenome]|mgnify:CR=1 FL=1|uniref:Flagellar hook-basal body complex protein FliE n=1 Tax=bioreactor metagenome TaxID=1076179 RepID=A0A645C514_9ZZZZ
MYIVPLSNLPSIESTGAGGTQSSGIAKGSGGVPFADVMKSAVENLTQAQQVAAQDSYDLAMGDVSNLHSMMIHAAQETTAVETVVQLTSRAVSSYKEIMQMQV